MLFFNERGFWGKHGMLSSQELGTFVNFRVVLNITVTSHESIKLSFNLFGWSGKNVEIGMLAACEFEKWTERVQSLGYNSAFSSL